MRKLFFGTLKDSIIGVLAEMSVPIFLMVAAVLICIALSWIIK